MPALSSRRAAGRFLAALAVVGAATAAVHGAAVADNFHRHHWEDRRFIRHTHAHVHGVVDCFTHAGVWPGLYRPLTTNCYYLAGSVGWRNRVEVYHLVNLAVYLAIGLLVFSVVRRVVNETLALFAAALWASRLAQWQTLLYTSEFQGLFAMLLSLVALDRALAARLSAPGQGSSGWRTEGLGLAAFALALLSKESAVALPAIVSAATWLYAPRAWRRDLLWWGTAAAWALLFAVALRGLSGTADTGYVYDVSPAIVRRYVGYLLMFPNGAVDPSDVWGVPRTLPELAALPAVMAPAVAAAVALLLLLALASRLPEGGAGRGTRAMALGGVWFLAGNAPFVVLSDRLFLRYSLFGNAGLALTLAALPAVLLDFRTFRDAAAARPAGAGPTPAPAPP